MSERRSERRYSAIEFRVEGRRLTGTVLRYGDVSPSHRERFEPGAFKFEAAVHLDLHHDAERAVAWHPGGGLVLTNGRDALTMTAELPPIPAADRALAEIRSGAASGLSVEFRSVKERQESGLRVIEAALLSGIGIVRERRPIKTPRSRLESARRARGLRTPGSRHSGRLGRPARATAKGRRARRSASRLVPSPRRLRPIPRCWRWLAVGGRSRAEARARWQSAKPRPAISRSRSTSWPRQPRSGKTLPARRLRRESLHGHGWTWTRRNLLTKGLTASSRVPRCVA